LFQLLLRNLCSNRRLILSDGVLEFFPFYVKLLNSFVENIVVPLSLRNPPLLFKQLFPGLIKYSIISLLNSPKLPFQPLHPLILPINFPQRLLHLTTRNAISNIEGQLQKPRQTISLLDIFLFEQLVVLLQLVEVLESLVFLTV
jgi:hypothetical protein